MTSIKKMKILCNTKIEKVEFSRIPFSHTIVRLCNGLTLTISIPIRYYLYMDCKYYIDIDVTYSYKKFNIKNIRFCSDGKLTKLCDINEFDNSYAYILMHYDFDLFDFIEEIKPFLQIYKREARKLKKKVLIKKGL